MNSYFCVVCNKWIYKTKYYISRKTQRCVSKDNTVSKDEHMSSMHGWCKLCDKEIPRKLHCVLKHKCKKNKAGCLLRYEASAVSLKHHSKENKHRWRNDIVIKENPKYYEPHMEDIDRPCAKCGWNVNICEPHHKGDYSRDQKGVNTMVQDDLPRKPVFAECYGTVKPVVADYKPGGKLNRLGENGDWRIMYKNDLKSYKSDLVDFEENELNDWKDAMIEYQNIRLEPYCGVNYYHPWCKND